MSRRPFRTAFWLCPGVSTGSCAQRVLIEITTPDNSELDGDGHFGWHRLSAMLLVVHPGRTARQFLRPTLIKRGQCRGNAPQAGGR